MKHAPVLPPRDESEEELSRFLTSLPSPPGIPTTAEEEEAAINRSLADVAAGRVHSHAVVGEWLDTWGKPEFTSFKDWLATRNG